MLYGLIAAVAVLAVVLFAMLRPKPAPAVAAPAPMMPPPQPMAPPMPRPATVTPIVPPPTPPSSRVASSAAATQAPGLATRPVGAAPPAGAAAGPKSTEMFIDLGAEVVAMDGPDRGRHFNLTKPMITIGRAGGRANEITLTDHTVSREHAKIVYAMADKTFRLINESTTNPVRLNGNPVDTAQLHDNDVIQLGATSLKFKKI